MAQFEVQTIKAKQISNNEEQISNKLKQIEQELENVIGNLHMDSSGIEQVKKNLRTNLSNVTTLQQRIHVLSTTLSQISSLYDSTEKGIAGSSVNHSKITDAISRVKNLLSNVSDKLRQTASALGIDGSSAYSSDPVNLCNGNYVYENTFLTMDTVMDMKFRIFYNIQNKELGALGFGWTHTYEGRMIAEGDQLHLQMDDGSLLSFSRYKDGLYYPLNGTIGSCVETEEGTVFTDHDNFSYIFDKKGRMLGRKNIFGDAIDYIYNEEGNLDHVVDNYGNTISFSYNEKLQISEVHDQSGRKIQLAYKNGQLSALKNVEGRTIRYEYDKHGWLYKLYNANGLIGLVNTYDEQGRTIHQVFPDGGKVSYDYQDDQGLVVMTEQNGNQVTYEHDSLFRNTRILYENGEERFTYDTDHNKTSYTDKRGNVSRYQYDVNGNRTEYISPLGDKLTYSFTEFNQLASLRVNDQLIHKADYDSNHRISTKEDARGAKEFYIYDEKGNVISYIQPDGSQIHMEYNEYGHLLSMTNSMGGKRTYEYDARHNVTAETDALGNRTEYTYNDADELILVKDADGNCSSYVYDKSGNPISITDFNGNTTLYEYNCFNKPVKITDGDGNVSTFAYDEMWNLVKQTDPEGGVYTFEYDKLHRMIRSTDPNGAVNELKYDACDNLVERKDPNGGIHRLSYDALNRPNEVIDPMGFKVRSEYDAFGNVTKVLYQDGSREEYGYDLLGNMTSSTDPDGYRKQYSYDLSGNLISVYDGELCLEEYEYYPGGLLKKEKYLNGYSKEYIYDQNENLIQVINESGGSWNFTYDRLQRVIKAEDPSGASEIYQYDAMGNLIHKTDGMGNGTDYVYNASGMMTSMLDALGNETRYLYDRCNRISGIIQSEEGQIHPEMLNQFNEKQKGLHIARSNEKQKGLRITRFERDAAGNITKQTNPAGQETHYTYDAEGRLTSQLDPDGHLTSCLYNADGSQKGFTFADGRSIRLSYNGLKQLVEMEDWLGSTKIDVDRMGRTLSVTTPDEKHISYEWGSRGEQTGITYPDGKKMTYHYDNQLRLSSAILDDAEVRYSYYENGKLKEKIYSNGFCSRYAYHKTGALSEILHSKGQKIIEKSLYEYDKNQRKARILRQREDGEASGDYRYEYTEQGSLWKVTHDGRTEEEYRYDSCGNRIWSQIFGQETEYSYNRLDQLISKKDAFGLHSYSYDSRGNLMHEMLGEEVTREYTFYALNRLRSVETPQAVVSYRYDGFGNRVGRRVEDGKSIIESSYLYDISRDTHNMLQSVEGQKICDVLWDGSLLGLTHASGEEFYLHDERMTPQYVIGGNDILASYQYDSFGVVHSVRGKSSAIHGYTGHRPDPMTGFLHADARDYDPSTGRFLSLDPMPGVIGVGLTLNMYSYCKGDPINYTDPSGMIAAWLGAGIVGAVANVATKAAGDVVNSVKNRKITVSSWQSYVGTASGGFVQGTVFVASGGNMAAAGAAGSATESLVTGGLSMATHAKGYTKEDGYSVSKLLMDTATSAGTGAVAGFAFQSASKYIKIPGINKGRGSFEAVWKQVMTKAANGTIQNITAQTLMKGLTAYGLEHFADQIIKKGVDAVKDYGKDLGKKVAQNVIDKITEKYGPSTLATTLTTLLGVKTVTATCPAGA